MLHNLTISDKVIKRPGSKETHFIPDPLFVDFWEGLYQELADSKNLRCPIDISSSRINPFFGYFGYRFHPMKFIPDYYHVGIDIDKEKGAKVFPTTNGIFEYSGYGNENGYYIMLSHPDYYTKDGFILNSLYLHLDKVNISFNNIEKILRTIGLIELTNKTVNLNQIIGISGDSGNSKDVFPHLHFQLEFRSKSQNKIILIDPAKALGLKTNENLTKDIQNFNEFKIFCEEHKTELSNWFPILKKHENENHTN